MSEHKTPTPEQLHLAKEYHIPKSQAHTININKVMAYRKWKNSEEGKLANFFDKLEEERERLQHM